MNIYAGIRGMQTYVLKEEWARIQCELEEMPVGLRRRGLSGSGERQDEGNLLGDIAVSH
jgi:hypothetical protein